MQELDFETEAANAARCAANLESPQSRVRGRVKVPAMQRDLSSARVLTMEYVEGAAPFPGLESREAQRAKRLPIEP